MKIINKLYSTGCPRCEQLKKILDNNNIFYEEINDKSAMIEKGFTLAPMFEIAERVMDYNTTINWIKGNR